MGDCLSQKSVNIRMKKTVKMSGLNKDDIILDVGCRDKRLSKYLPSGIEYHALDLVEGEGVVKCDLNRQKIPFPDNLFDCVFCLEVLEHINCPIEVLKELKRVSKGKIIISVPNPYHYRDVIKHILRIPDKQGHIISFIYSNLWRICEELNLKITEIRGSFFLPFLPSNSRILSRHQILNLKF